MLPALNWTSPGSRRAVIMGCGQIGSSIAGILAEDGWSLHMIDLDPAAFSLLPAGMINDGQVVAIVGDGTLESDLRKSSTQDAEVFVAVSGKDARNALAAQIAKHVLQVKTVICRVNDPASKEMYEQFGIVTVSATALVTDMILQAARS